jgi:putative membrane protein
VSTDSGRSAGKAVRLRASHRLIARWTSRHNGDTRCGELDGEDEEMAGFLIRLLVVAAGLWLASELVPGFHAQGGWTLIGAALLLGLVNAVIRPLLVILTLPITVVTLGFFLLVINAAMLGLVALLFDNFTISGFWPAVGGAIILSLTGWLASYFIGPKGRIDIIVVRGPGGGPG